MSFDSNQSYTYQIKKYKSSKPYVIVAIIIIAIIIFVLHGAIPNLISKLSSKSSENVQQISSPESIVRLFIEAVQKNDYDKILSYIDFDAMVLFDSANQDVDRFIEIYSNSNNFSDYERQIFEESTSYTKGYIKSTLERIENDEVNFNVIDIKNSSIQGNIEINKIVVKMFIEDNGTNKNEEMIFYTMKKGNDYRIIKFDGKIYF